MAFSIRVLQLFDRNPERAETPNSPIPDVNLPSIVNVGTFGLCELDHTIWTAIVYVAVIPKYELVSDCRCELGSLPDNSGPLIKATQRLSHTDLRREAGKMELNKTTRAFLGIQGCFCLCNKLPAFHDPEAYLSFCLMEFFGKGFRHTNNELFWWRRARLIGCLPNSIQMIISKRLHQTELLGNVLVQAQSKNG